ncbi:MAG: nitrilase-related carbon-nitrogen hydrolase, partial [Candidatus Omnitrophota bacterium]|nr:nitrilase-related carbon-nitrogen hydrolase [Candidatus Omnitrophota bacterium]
EVGRDPALVSFREVPIGSFICQEVMFADPIRQTVRAGAQLLITTGNDGVFLNPAVGETLHAMAVLRAVEHRRYIVRSMKTGISSVIDPTGKIMALAPQGVRATVSAAVLPQSAVTYYDRFSWGLALCCGALVALILRTAPRQGPS